MKNAQRSKLKAPRGAATELAFAACRSICFATENAVRHGGDYSLNDLLAADKLARAALAGSALSAPSALKTPKKRGAA